MEKNNDKNGSLNTIEYSVNTILYREVQYWTEKKQITVAIDVDLVNQNYN